MDDVNELIIYKPNMEETKKKYLQRYTDNEIQRIMEDDLKLIEFVLTLRETSWPEDSEQRKVENTRIPLTLQKRIKPLVQYDIARWQQKREDVLQFIVEFKGKMYDISTLISAMKIMGYAVDALLTMGGLFLNLVKLPVSMFLRFLYIYIEIGELTDDLEELVKHLKEDQELFSPIESWLYQCEELEEAMANIFPFNSTKVRVNEFFDAIKEKRSFYDMGFFKRQPVKKNYSENFQSNELIRNSLRPGSYSSFQEYCGWFFFRTRNAVLIDLARITVESFYSPLRFFMRALTPEDESLYSTYVWGCLFLNGLYLVNEINTFRSFEYHELYYVRHLENHLRLEVKAFNHIITEFDSANLH